MKNESSCIEENRLRLMWSGKISSPGEEIQQELQSPGRIRDYFESEDKLDTQWGNIQRTELEKAVYTPLGLEII